MDKQCKERLRVPIPIPCRREQYIGMAWGILFISVEGMPKAL